MTRRDFEQELSQATGESVRTLRKRGFSLMVAPDREPLTVDWDAVQQVEPQRYQPRRPRPVRLAA